MRRILSVIVGLKSDVVVIWVAGQKSGNTGAKRLKYAVTKGVMEF